MTVMAAAADFAYISFTTERVKLTGMRIKVGPEEIFPRQKKRRPRPDIVSPASDPHQTEHGSAPRGVSVPGSFPSTGMKSKRLNAN